MEATINQLTKLDTKMNAVESAASSDEIHEIMALDDLKRVDDDNTDLLPQEIYPEYRHVFPLAQLGMELIF